MSTHTTRPNITAASTLQTQAIDWLWPSWLALGKVAVLDGDPGLGKSFITLDLCARLSAGQPFPDGSPGSPPASSIVLNGEDGGEDTIRPRLAALGADLARVFVLRPHLDTGAPLSFPPAVGLLDAAILQTGARLVVIDPIMAFLDPSVVTASDQAIRRALLPLALLAERRHCAILLVRHLNKSGRSHALYRGGGSIGLVGACRSAFLVALDPTGGPGDVSPPGSKGDPTRRVLAQVKNNLAPLQPGLGYHLAPGDHGPPTVQWLGPRPYAADELLARQQAAPRPGPRGQARMFLQDFLEAGPRTSRDIWAAALARHLTEASLRRAKSDLGILTTREWADGLRRSLWSLPGQPPPAQATPAPADDDDSGDLEPWLGPLREKYPLPTPLDDL